MNIYIRFLLKRAYPQTVRLNRVHLSVVDMVRAIIPENRDISIVAVISRYGVVRTIIESHLYRYRYRYRYRLPVSDQLIINSSER